jgi:hypothetical protein
MSSKTNITTEYFMRHFKSSRDISHIVYVLEKNNNFYKILPMESGIYLLNLETDKLECDSYDSQYKYILNKLSCGYKIHEFWEGRDLKKILMMLQLLR